MIEIKNLTKYYGTTKALNDVSLSMQKGEITGLLGPNGAGKTTLLKIITGFIRQNSGIITIDNEITSENSLLVRKKIGYLPENNPLYHDYKVIDFLNFCAKVRDIPKSSRKEIIERTASQCKIEDVLYKFIDTLSKGYRQRVGLAQAILHNPEILILDEPTTGLDPNQIVETRNLIKNLSKDKTVIFSTHILQEVSALCDKVIILNKGEKVKDTSASNLSNEFGNSCIFRLTVNTEKNISKIISTLNGVENVEFINSNKDNSTYKILSTKNSETKTKLFKLLSTKDISVIELYDEKTNLEDVFKKLTSS